MKQLNTTQSLQYFKKSKMIQNLCMYVIVSHNVLRISIQQEHRSAKSPSYFPCTALIFSYVLHVFAWQSLQVASNTYGQQLQDGSNTYGQCIACAGNSASMMESKVCQQLLPERGPLNGGTSPVLSPDQSIAPRFCMNFAWKDRNAKEQQSRMWFGTVQLEEKNTVHGTLHRLNWQVTSNHIV